MLDKYDTQYEDNLRKIYEQGFDTFNERTGLSTRQLILIDQEYDVENNRFPLCTTRKSYWKQAIAEFLGYLRGYDNAADYRAIGCNTWNANANENKAWLSNPNRKGTDDMGRAYGKQIRAFVGADGTTIDQLRVVYDKLRRDIDDRRLIITLHNPADSHLSCLDACMWNHTFALNNGKLDLFSNQRSADWALGSCWNQAQCFFFLAIMAQITGHKAGKVYHRNVNAHIYENQLPLVPEQLSRTQFKTPKFFINPDIKTLEDLETWVTTDDFWVEGYEYHPAIAYPFSV